MTYTLSGAAQTIVLPQYNVYTGSSNLPANDSGGAAMLTVKVSQNNFDNATIPAGQMGDVFTSLLVSKSTSFGPTGTLIPFTVTSPCIVSGRVYTISEYGAGSRLYNETDTANGTSLTGHISEALNPFPSGLTVDVIVTH